MQIRNDAYTVTISVDGVYAAAPAQHGPYDVVWNPAKLHRDGFLCIHSILVEHGAEQWRGALVGNELCYDTNCAILEGSLLTVLQWDALTQIDLRSRAAVFRRRLPCTSNCFGIYRCPSPAEGFMIWGELEIIKLSAGFDVEWCFSGADMFARPDDLPVFQLQADRVALCDWLGNRYEVGYSDGAVLFQKMNQNGSESNC